MESTLSASESNKDHISLSRPQPTSNPTIHPHFHPAPPIARSRYNRQILIPSISLSGQTRISQSKVLVVGLGGLGSPASLYLAGAGVHTLGLLDHDVVEQSNLHRQIAHRESSVSDGEGGQGRGRGPMSKVQSALRSCRELNGDVDYVAHEVRLNGANALDIIGGYDVVLDCTDNPATRYLVSDCCVALGKTLVSGAAQKLEGQMVVLNWPVYDGEGEGPLRTVRDRGPCYRCIFPHPPSPDMVKSCSEIGILGPVVGTIGTLMASETLRLVVKDGNEDRKATMLLYNAWPSDPRSMFRKIGLRNRRKDCVACGEGEVLREKGIERVMTDSIREGSVDYESWCGIVEDINLLEENKRISASNFLEKLGRQEEENEAMVVDVREKYEVELGPKIDGSINIPFSTILQNSTVAAKSLEHKDPFDPIFKDPAQGPVYFVCQRGNDSQIAARKLLDRAGYASNSSETETTMTRWIGDVKGGFVAIEKYARPYS